MKKVYLLLLLVLSITYASAQSGFVRADGKRIVDPDGNNLILRGIGTGNWVLQEGYMMNTGGIAGTQWEFRQKLAQNIGEEKADEFYEAWWANHFTKSDVDSLKKWGFNSVRIALHYKMLTLPIEEESIEGEDTWLERGFKQIDDVLDWCESNEMYLILDMHGAPGSQGANADISDYDPSKPSLWESEENKRKLIALWKKLAERYANEKWIAGYDLINETNWDALKTNNNKDLWDLFEEITIAIREVDENHLIFLSGNDWGNNYAGLPSMWDNNTALSFHKYWNATDQWELDFITSLRDQHNVPIWLGETGENSNTWFAEVVKLCEDNNIGWSWWPVKKTGINNVMRSLSNPDYDAMINGWRSGNFIDATRAYNGVMAFAEAHKAENCIVQYDVIDALIRRPHIDGTIPFKKHNINQTIFAVDYDMGNNGEAYYDVDDININLSDPTKDKWNQGWSYRNDGVDIEACTDTETNGYSVGWIEDGEWLSYTVTIDETKIYTPEIRYASQGGGGKIALEIDGKIVSTINSMPSTNGWKTWQTISLPEAYIEAGTSKVKLIFEQGGFNLNYIKFSNAKDLEDVAFKQTIAETDIANNKILLFFNKPVDSYNINAFSIKINGKNANINAINSDINNPVLLIAEIDEDIFSTDEVLVSYDGSGLVSGSEVLSAYENFNVANKITTAYEVFTRVEAEDFFNKNGFSIEETSDSDNSDQLGFAVSGDYADYLINSPETKEYYINFRVAVNGNNASINIYSLDSGSPELIKEIKLDRTGGWATWKTQSEVITLNKGKNILRFEVKAEAFNFNWFEINTDGQTENETGGVIVVNENILIDGNMEVEGSWSTAALGSTIPVTATFNYTDNLPTGAEGGALRVKADLEIETSSNIALYQKIAVKKDHIYTFDGLFKNIGNSENLWVQTYIVSDMPSQTTDNKSLDEKRTLGQLNFWSNEELRTYDGPISGLASIGENHNGELLTYTHKTSDQDMYFVIKIGTWNYALDIVLDELVLKESRIEPSNIKNTFSDIGWYITADKELVVENGYNNKIIEIYTLNGEEVVNDIISDRISLSFLNKGVYIVRLYEKQTNKNTVFKLIF